MRYLLSKANVDVLAQFAWSKGVLAFDYDGTLAPIVTDRAHARMTAHTRSLLAQACRLYPCAVISGRASPEVRAFLGDVPIKHVLGNHGMEPGRNLTQFKTMMSVTRTSLLTALKGEQGIDIEDKTYSLSVHYRRSRQRAKAHRAVEQAIARLTVQVRTIPGKCVVNILPRQAKTKGDALLAIRDQERADTAIYFGDDDTDEDVFRLDEPGRLTTVRIGIAAESAAAYYLRRQLEIDEVLRRLIALRSQSRKT
jgi:trehalose 6-phosphate phosphatase